MVKMNLQKDGSLWVKERIVYNFGPFLKHGIYRDIPARKIRISNIRVFDDKNKSYSFKVEDGFNSIGIKIGDPKKPIKGEHVYNILYKVDKAVLLNDIDETFTSILEDNMGIKYDDLDPLTAAEYNLIYVAGSRARKEISGSILFE